MIYVYITDKHLSLALSLSRSLSLALALCPSMYSCQVGWYSLSLSLLSCLVLHVRSGGIGSHMRLYRH